MRVSSITANPFVVLIIDQSQSLRCIYQGYLEALVPGPAQFHLAGNGRDALTAANEYRPDLIILDLGLDDIKGHELVNLLRRHLPDATLLAVAVQTSLDRAVYAVRVGATDILIKPLNHEKFRHAIQSITARATPAAKNLPAKVMEICAGSGFIGISPAMQVVYKSISVAAPSNATVFITGESGTGKELYAEAIHQHSGRAGKALISLNCSAIPRDLIESEIFGHVRGAFTGAIDDRDGVAILADKGTLFLDEICEMDLELQAKLLRFIQTSKVQKVGDSRTREVDVRFVCATNRDLAKEVASGRFREDLYYRLHVIPVHLPPLREREGDIQLLASTFLRRFAAEEGKTYFGFHPDALKALRANPWPGNVRQLENLIQNIVVMNDGGQVTEAMLPLGLLNSSAKPDKTRPPQEDQSSTVIVQMPSRQTIDDAAPARQAGLTDPSALVRPLWIIEKETIEQAIRHCGGNTVLAAAMLEVSPSTLYRKIKAWAKPGKGTAKNFSATG